MTIEDLLNALSEYPKDLDLKQVKVYLSINKVPNVNRIQSAYIAGYRIAGSKPLGYLHHMERETDLRAIAISLLHGLKMNTQRQQKPN